MAVVFNFKPHTLIKLRNLSKYFYATHVKSFEHVEVQGLHGSNKGIVVIGLNRPEARNALSKKLLAELADAIDTVKQDDQARTVILRSLVPGIFCAGADLKERLKMSVSETKAFVPKLRVVASSIENLPTPVIAAIDGAALGGGLEFSLACDMRVSSSTAKLGLVETKLGIFPGAGGTQRLPRIVGSAIAKELIFTGRIIDGYEAWKLGIVNCVVDQNDNGDAAYTKALEMAYQIISNGPVGVKLSKFAINKGLEVDINTGNAIEEACYAQLLHTKDRIEGLKAFVEKRVPVYTGE